MSKVMSSEDVEGVEGLRRRLGRLHDMFDLAGVSIWECQLGAVLAEITRMGQGAPAKLDVDGRLVRHLAGLLKIETVNDTGLKLLGAPTREMLSACIEDLVRDEAVPLFRALWKALARGEKRIKVEGKLYRLDGSDLHVALALTVPDVPGELAILAITDTTFQHMGREAELAAERRAEELSRINDEVEKLFHAVSHDMRAPLRAVLNLAQWISEDLAAGNGEGVAAHVSQLSGRVSRLDLMMNDLLTYARAGRVEQAFESLQVSELLAEVRALAALPAAFEFSWAEPMPRIVTQRTLLVQVFLNLVGNAVKHHDKGQGRIHVQVTDLDSFVEFTVTDDGPGIPEKFRERIFGLFTTLKRRDEVEGSGMGLAFVQKVVRSVGGKIQAVGPEGRGATFVFTWPKGPTARIAPSKRSWPTLVGLDKVPVKT
jgi:signal transduction histidine kinase